MPALQRPRPGDRHPVPDVPRRGPGHRRAHVPGRRARRRRHRLDAAATGRGAAGPRGGGAGDLYVHLRVAPHERYRRDGNDLVTDVPSRSPRPRSARRSRCRRSTATRSSSSRPAPSPAGVRAAQPRRAPRCRAAAGATSGPSSSSRCRRSSTTRRRTAAPARRAARRGRRPARQRLVLADQVRVLVAVAMDEACAGRPPRPRRHSTPRCRRPAPPHLRPRAPPARRARASPSPTRRSVAAVPPRRGCPGPTASRKRPARPALTVAVPQPKGDRLEWMVQKCTEVGVALVQLADATVVVRWDDARAASSSTGCAGSPRRPGCSPAGCGSRRSYGPLPATAVLNAAVAAEPGWSLPSAGDTRSRLGAEAAGRPRKLAVGSDWVCLGPHVLRVRDGGRGGGGSAWPVRGGPARSRAPQPARPAVRGLCPRPVLCDPLRDCALATLDRPGPHLVGDYLAAVCPRSTARSTGAWPRRRACSSAAARRRWSRPPPGRGAAIDPPRPRGPRLPSMCTRR